MKKFLLKHKQKKNNVYQRTSNILFLEAEESFIRTEEQKEESAFESRYKKYIKEIENELRR